MSLLEKNINEATDLELDKTIYLVNPITLDVLKYNVGEILDLLKTLKGESTLDYIDSIASTKGYCKTLKANMFYTNPTIRELKSLINIIGSDIELLPNSPETLERDIYLVNQWTGITESFTVKQVLGYLGSNKTINNLNAFMRRNRYCAALKSYVFFKEPTVKDIKNVLGYHRLDDEVYRQIKSTPYQISQYGRVKRVNPKFDFRSNFILPTIRPKNRNENYVAINLNINGQKRLLSLAKLVGLSFVRNPDPKNNKYLVFKDGNTLNYIYSNLVWKDSLKKKFRLHKMKNIGNNTNANKTVFLVSPTTLEVSGYAEEEILDLLKSLKCTCTMDYINKNFKNGGYFDKLKCYIFASEPSSEKLKSLINLVDDDTVLLDESPEMLEKDIFLVNQWTGITESFTVKEVLKSLGSDFSIYNLNYMIKNNNRHCPKLNSYLFYEKPSAKDIKNVLGFHVIPDEVYRQYNNTPYYISQYGRVKSYKLGVKFRSDFIIPTIRPKNRSEVYVAVRFYIDKKRVSFPLGSLVGTLFVSNNDPKNKKYLHYKDNNTLNYIYSNLEWKETPQSNPKPPNEEEK